MPMRRCVFSWFENGCDDNEAAVVAAVVVVVDDDAVWELDWDDGCEDVIWWLFVLLVVLLWLLLIWLFEFEPFEEPTELAGDGGGISLGLDCNVCNWDWLFLLLLFWLVEMLDYYYYYYYVRMQHCYYLHLWFY